MTFQKDELSQTNTTDATRAYVKPILGTLAAAGVTGTYAKLVANTSGYKHNILFIWNKLDLDVYVSIDGTNNHYFCGNGGSFIIDLGPSNSVFHGELYVKTVSGGAAASGNIYGTLT